MLAAGLAQPLIANDIEPSKEFYTAARAGGAITVDGNLSEWAGVPVLSDPRFSICAGQEGTGQAEGCGDAGTLVLFERYQGGDWTGPNDHTSAVQVAYDNDNIYFGFVVTDEYHENAALSAWNGDSVQLMVANAARTTQVGLYNYALGGVEGDTGDVIIMHEAGPGETEAVVVRDSVGKKTIYEIKLPASALGLTAPLAAGTRFGLGMAINDGDEATPGQKGWGGLGAHSIVYNGKDPTETALVTLGASDTTVELLGVGAEFLLGGDLTDPENNGDELLGPNDPSWNWAGITSSIEPGFGGGEFSFNIFDNLVGGGNDKWCCDDPTVANPHWVAVQFGNPVSLTHFTITSGNDSPDRDPTKFQIQGSQDGATYTTIYNFDNATAVWDARNQVAKFTLPAASPLYRYIRYFVTETPGTLHQINEIEYFGTVGGADRLFLSAINPTFQSFTFRANNAGASIVAPATGKLTIDGQVVTLANVTTGGATDFSYQPATPFLPNSDHTYVIEVRDTLGNIVTASNSFRVANYALLRAADRVTADTTKAGFVFNVHQNASFQANDNTRPVEQLAGRLGVNQADPAAQGTALTPGVSNVDPNLPIRFEIPGVINFNQDAPGDAGAFNATTGSEDAIIPGIPGLETSTDGIAAEILTYIELPAGLTTMIFNSDDGFRTTAGLVEDVFLGQLAGQFVGGRGASDTVFSVFAEAAGVYPFRTIWYEGGGGANLEWSTVKPDGTGTNRALINDIANGGLKAYRALGGAAVGQASVTRISPTPNASGVFPDADLEATLADAQGSAVDPTTVSFTLDGTAVNTVATKAGTTTTVRAASTGALAAGSAHTVILSFTAGGTVQTRTFSFTNANYTTLSSANGTLPGSGRDPGFRIRTVQSDTALATADAAAERQLLDNFGNPNVADLTGAVGGFFTHTGVINFEQDGAAAGNFTDANGNADSLVPGIPGTGVAPTDNFAQEVLTYLDLPAGILRMGVNSDDGFNLKSLTAADTNVAPMGIFNGGRGASDTIFAFRVPVAGVYPMRLIWYEGGGGANAEWFTITKAGVRTLINSADAGSVKAFRSRDETQKLPSDGATISAVRQGANLVITFTGRLQSSDSAAGPYTDVAGAVSGSPIPTTGARKFYRSAQ